MATKATNNDFEDFLKKAVNLNQSRLDRLETSLTAVINFLQGNLLGYSKFSAQGSYAQKTIIKPVHGKGEFDADSLIFIRDYKFDPATFTDYIDRVYHTLKSNASYADKIHRKTRCVMMNYAGDFHIDIVPAIEHYGKIYICNRQDSQYEQTDGDAYKGWLIEKNRIAGNNSLRKAIRLFKFLRDHKGNFSVKSILLTTLLGMQISSKDNNSPAFSDLITTLVTLSNRLNDYLKSCSSIPLIENPVLPGEDFVRHWDARTFRNFKEKFAVYTRKINEAYASGSIKKWRELFGDDFAPGKDGGDGNDSGPSGSGKKRTSSTASVVPPLVVPATKPYANSGGILHSTKNIAADLARVQQYFPGLQMKRTKGKRVLSGNMSFSARYQLSPLNHWNIHLCTTADEKSYQCTQGDYDVRIELSSRARVYETSGKIERAAQQSGRSLEDAHLNSDRSCCLTYHTSSRLTLAEFVLNRVYPYFVWQAYRSQYGELPPVGEYPHYFVAAQLELVKYFMSLNGDMHCYCGKSIQFKHCCGKLLHKIVGEK